jgi:hypothetical protein
MTLKKHGISMELEGIISRLEDARDNAIELLGSRDVELQSDDLDADVVHDIEGAESAFLVAEQQIDEMTQVISEEIDNLRSLLERIKENRSGEHRLG